MGAQYDPEQPLPRHEATEQVLKSAADSFGRTVYEGPHACAKLLVDGRPRSADVQLAGALLNAKGGPEADDEHRLAAARMSGTSLMASRLTMR